jgi:hypothetical protein
MSSGISYLYVPNYATNLFNYIFLSTFATFSVLIIIYHNIFTYFLVSYRNVDSLLGNDRETNNYTTAIAK